MAIEVKTEMLEKLLAKYDKDLVRNALNVMDIYTQKIANEAKLKVRDEGYVDTGLLMNLIRPSVRVYIAKIRGTVNAGTKYARYIHEGAEHTSNAETGARAFKNIVGEHGKITDESEDVRRWIKYLDRAKPRSVVTLHNHNNATSFSLEDLKLFLSKDSIKTMIVVDDVGNMFLLEKKPGVVYNADELVKNYGTELLLAFEKIQKLDVWGGLSIEEKDEWKKHMYNAVLKKYLKMRGFWYGEFKAKNNT